MKIYIDNDYKCHTAPDDDLIAVETNAFDGRCKRYIEGYRFVPAGQTWTRSDGQAFEGEMIAPAEDSRILEAVQAQYEEMLAEMEAMKEDNADMAAVLNDLGVSE